MRNTFAGSRLMEYDIAKQIARTHLATFDAQDFDIFTHRKWDRMHESHTKDILVHWPDGHETRGLEQHIEELKQMFAYAPDARIQMHPVRIANGDWTSVIGVMEGTFAEPMPTRDGSLPAGKPFKLMMCTVAHWNNGAMDEEYLFWDNQSLLTQIGRAG